MCGRNRFLQGLGEKQDVLWGKCEFLLWQEKAKGHEEASVKTGIMRRSWKVSVTHHTLCVNVLSWSMLSIPSPHTTIPPYFLQKPLVTQLPAGIRGRRFQCHSASLGITPNLQKQRCVLTSSNLRFYSFPAMIILLRDIWKPVTAICGCNLICHQRKKKKKQNCVRLSEATWCNAFIGNALISMLNLNGVISFANIWSFNIENSY